MATWIFQGNPDDFEIDSYLADSNGTIQWRTTNYSKVIAPGDRVYLWRSKGSEGLTSGVIAEGAVTESPRVQRDEAWARRYWRKRIPNDSIMQVRVRLTRIARRDSVLSQDAIRRDRILSKMLIVRRPSGTNFPMTAGEAARLAQLWRGSVLEPAHLKAINNSGTALSRNKSRERAGTFSVEWHSTDAAGYTDVLPAKWFAKEVTGLVVWHVVKGPRGGKDKAMCEISVKGRNARLNYEKFVAENRRHRMSLGIMELQFIDHERRHIGPVVRWKKVGGTFSCPNVHVSEEINTELESDLGEIFDRRAISPRRRRALVNARLGQGQFRLDVMSRWDSACSVTGTVQAEILRASHIKAWSKCASDVERCDPSNGLLLSANLDALFDKYMITFDRNGRLLVSRDVSPRERKRLDLDNRRLRLALRKDQQKYLQHHRFEFAQRDRN